MTVCIKKEKRKYETSAELDEFQYFPVDIVRCIIETFQQQSALFVTPFI